VTDLAALETEVRACRHCAAHLPLGPRPILHVSTNAPVLITSQAPGTAVHAKGLSFWDASGDRLRAWLGVDRDAFYDVDRFAILPMGLCYPGRLPQGGDAPPRPECAPLWRERILAAMPQIRLTLLVGTYAQDYALGRGTMTDRVRHFQRYLPSCFPLPHPSWRTAEWERKNPWFGQEVIPALRSALADAFAADAQPFVDISRTLA
jgi:uracil-DNA glycosylase